MGRVLVICSVHYPLGNATAEELHWLLGRLRPDVIFLEHTAANHSAFLDGTAGTLESSAVMHYHNHHAVELVPVDVELDAEKLRSQIDEMFDRIERASMRYCQLVLTNSQHTERGGFVYLNSPFGAQLQSEMQDEMRVTVDAGGDPKLAVLYSLWTSTNDQREWAMINGVEQFAKRASFGTGVLLVGAGHRRTLFEKVQAHTSDVTWDFDWDLEFDQNGGTAKWTR